MGLIAERNFAFQNGLGLTIKQLKTHHGELKKANPTSLWAYIWEGVLSEGYLCLTFGGLIFGRAYFWRGLLSEFYGILSPLFYSLKPWNSISRLVYCYLCSPDFRIL